MPAISVIVPVYNVEKKLGACVESILAQSFADFELILVDDGSPDCSGEICEEYAQKDARVRVLHQTNQGQSAARNHGVEIAKADWICYVDSDDIVHPQMLEHLYTAVTTTGVRMSMCSAVEGTELPRDFFNPILGTAQVSAVDEKLMKRLYTDDPHRYWVIWGKLIDKAIVTKYPLAEGRIYEDSAVVCKWLYEAGNIADIEAPLYFYWVNEEGTTKSAFSPKRFDLLWSMEEQIAFFRKIGYNKMLQIVCDGYMWKAVEHYPKALDELQRKDIARHVRRKATGIYLQNRKIIGLPPKSIKYCAEIFYPKIMGLYWVLHSKLSKSTKDE